MRRTSASGAAPPGQFGISEKSALPPAGTVILAGTRNRPESTVNSSWVASAAGGTMVAVAVITMNKLKLQERQGRWLKLISGLVVSALGMVLLIAPEIMI